MNPRTLTILRRSCTLVHRLGYTVQVTHPEQREPADMFT